MTHIALLRGINVGGKGKLPMKELAAIFTAVGAASVQTYIQSGNVVFESAAPEAVVEGVTKQIVAQYGYPGRIVLRSAVELRGTYAANPFLKTGALSEEMHVYFLADVPAAAEVKLLEPERSPGDSFAVVGRDIYLHLPHGMARTKLTNTYFDTKLQAVSTARNWNTVGKLVAMLGQSCKLFQERASKPL